MSRQLDSYCQTNQNQSSLTLLIGLIFMLPLVGCAGEFDDVCKQLKSWEKVLPDSSRVLLQNEGFVLTPSNMNAPEVLISDKIIPSCKKRFIAQKYFINKINGWGQQTNRHNNAISPEDFHAAKKDIAYAVYKALGAKGVWNDGVSHEIYNTVSDELQPYWLKWLEKNIEERGVDLNYFTKQIFENVDLGLRQTLDKRLQTKLQNFEAALIYFLKKNSGEQLDLKKIKNDLKSRGTNADGLYPSIVKDALEMLSKKSKITIEEALEFEANIFGWV